MNINECFAGTATCHRNAACEDRDATVNASVLYECICPPGLVGDGVTSCDLPKFQTQLTLEQPGTTIEEFDGEAFKQMLYDTGAVPPTISPDKVYVSATDGSDGGGRRRLLSDDSANETQAWVDTTAAEGNYNANETRALVDATAAEGSSGGRRLLQTSGLQIKVTIYSESQEVMSNVTSAINITVLQGTGFVVLALPTSYVNPYQVGAGSREMS